VVTVEKLRKQYLVRPIKLGMNREPEKFSLQRRRNTVSQGLLE
jgi:hypothetical protein